LLKRPLDNCFDSFRTVCSGRRVMSGSHFCRRFYTSECSLLVCTGSLILAPYNAADRNGRMACLMSGAKALTAIRVRVVSIAPSKQARTISIYRLKRSRLAYWATVERQFLWGMEGKFNVKAKGRTVRHSLFVLLEKRNS